MPGGADAVAREIEFLCAVNDGLPALLTADGGRWDVVQAYWPRTVATRQTGIYLMRRTFTSERWSNQRRLETADFQGKLRWPLGSTTVAMSMWESEQAAFDAAIADLVTRIYGYVTDHTHGGRFLSVAEAPEPGRVVVHFDDPEHTLVGNPATLSATIAYSADDPDFTI